MIHNLWLKTTRVFILWAEKVWCLHRDYSNSNSNTNVVLITFNPSGILTPNHSISHVRWSQERKVLDSHVLQVRRPHRLDFKIYFKLRVWSSIIRDCLSTLEFVVWSPRVVGCQCTSSLNSAIHVKLPIPVVLQYKISDRNQDVESETKNNLA